MEITEEQVRQIVHRVVSGISPGAPETVRPGIPQEGDGVFTDMNRAIEAAHEAFLKFESFGLQDRKRFTDAVRNMMLDHREDFAVMAVEQTGMGRVKHKIAKNVNAAVHSPGIEWLQPQSWSGKNGLAVDEYAAWGVIGNIMPSTHPAAAMVNNIIIQVCAGNAIAFNPHPSAKSLSVRIIRLANQAMVREGAPENLVTCVAEPTMETAEILFSHAKTPLLSVTGGPGLVAAAMKHPKPIIAAGPGNPPVLIDETADLDLAAKEITGSASFDNNILCIAEKEIFVLEGVFEAFMRAFEKAGNVRLSAAQMDTLASKALAKPGRHWIISRDFVGRNANVLGRALGMNLSEDVPLLFGETRADDPWVLAEQMTPCIPVIRVKDFEQGVSACYAAEHGFEHTASIFTKDMNRATEFAKRMKTDVLVINGGTLRGNGGDSGEGYFSHTIASPTGQGICTPRDFVRRRRIMTSGALRFV
ncbi:aldehyde dehydrogenase [bacterium]|nr:aldehyde dehydrogenase [bacterium]